MGYAAEFSGAAVVGDGLTEPPLWRCPVATIAVRVAGASYS